MAGSNLHGGIERTHTPTYQLTSLPTYQLTYSRTHSLSFEVHDEIERLLVLLDELRDTAKQLLGASAENLAAEDEHEARATALPLP